MQAILQREPHLAAAGLLRGGEPLDFVNNDARLVIANIMLPAELGGQLASRVLPIGVLQAAAGQVNGY